MENMPPETVFTDIINDDNLVFITGYDSISYYFDPLSLPFLNTLTSIQTGSGYWVKIFNQDEVTHIGVPIPSDFTINLRAGWNLIGYWLQGSMDPEDAFNQLINDGNLIYVTAFGDEGAMFFEPGGILNTLGILENGYGYWLKVAEDVEDFQYPSNPQFAGKSIHLNSNPDINKTNIFMYVNGTISFTGTECESGTKVNVLTDTGLLVGELLILEEELIQTGAIYGDDPTTESIDGALLNQPLKFVYKHQTDHSDEISFSGNMELKKINLVFDSSPEKFSFLRSFPNPFNSTTTIQFSLGENPIIISPSAIQIYDLRGNLVKTLPFSHSVPGNYSIKWDGTNELGKPLSSGIYFCTLKNEKSIETLKLVLLN
jgi:hypothetical protein